MEVINYFASNRQEYWLAEIGKSDWSAGQFLYKLLKNGELKDYVGENVEGLQNLRTSLKFLFQRIMKDCTKNMDVNSIK